MSDTAHPRFFDRFPMQHVSDAVLDALLVDDDAIRILFLWGRDCPNCDVAKGQLLLGGERFRWPDVQWLHDNVYDDPTMAALRPARHTGVRRVPRRAQAGPDQPVAGHPGVHRRDR